MPLTRIERWDVRRDGPLSEASLQRKIESRGFEVSARIYPAALAETTVSDDRESVTAVVRGHVRLTLDGDPELLTDGDVAFIPARTARRLEAAGSAPALCLEAHKR
jgi:mannose-6-phosphate isomerase-like protein (cupin superfamily)